MQNFNLHTHSIYSDGKSQPREIVEEAVRQGLTTLGFSEHSPLPFDNNFSVKEADMPRYVAEIDQLKTEFKDKIDIYCGLEADYLTGVSEPFAVTKEKYHLDYLIGGVHLVVDPTLRQVQGPEETKVVEPVETPTQTINPDEIWFIDGPKWEVYDEGLQKFFDGDIRRAVRRFFEQSNEMIENEPFDIIAHFDKIKMHNRDRYFHEDEPWYRKLALETLDLIREKGLVMEINTRGIYKKRYNGFYPSPWLMEEACKMGVPAIISADAHHFSEITLEFSAAEEALKKAGYRSVANFKDGRWVEVAIS
ncbi:MAG: histidinol-phosphatase [Bacteroidales bacterium]|nr:histidinol-phosphatase [Bacteroidales bacterium]